MPFFSNLFKHSGSAFSSIDIVSQCLVDTRRTGALEEAIRETIHPWHTVLDVGTGSGILSLFAARAGAKKIIAIEYDPFIAKMAEHVIQANNFEQKIEVRVANGSNYIFEQKLRFDVVIMELLTTGMIDEYQVPAINNLHKNSAITPNTIFIPCQHDTFAALGNFNFNCYGFSIPFTRHLWNFHKPEMREFTPLSDDLLVSSIDFKKENPEKFKTTLIYTAVRDGEINALYLRSVTRVTPHISIADTDALNGPVAIPVKKFPVKAGQKVTLSLAYTFGGGYEQVKASFI